MKPQPIVQRISAQVEQANEHPLTIEPQPGWRKADLDEFMSVVDDQLSDESLGLTQGSRDYIHRQTREYLEQSWHSAFVADDGTAIVVSDKYANVLIQPGDVEAVQRSVTDLQSKVPCPKLTIQIDNNLMAQMTDGEESALAATTTGSVTPLMAMTTRIAGKRDTLRKKYGSEVAEHWWPDELADFPAGQVILAHEWGHAITDLQEMGDHFDALYTIADNASDRRHVSWVSQYALHSPQEFIAESFAVWYLTKGQTKSRGAQSVAKVLGWAKKYPKVLEGEPEVNLRVQHPVVRRNGE